MEKDAVIFSCVTSKPVEVTMQLQNQATSGQKPKIDMLNELMAGVCTLRKIPSYLRLQQVSVVKLLQVFMER